MRVCRQGAWPFTQPAHGMLQAPLVRVALPSLPLSCPARTCAIRRCRRSSRSTAWRPHKVASGQAGEAQWINHKATLRSTSGAQTGTGTAARTGTPPVTAPCKLQEQCCTQLCTAKQHTSAARLLPPPLSCRRQAAPECGKHCTALPMASGRPTNEHPPAAPASPPQLPCGRGCAAPAQSSATAPAAGGVVSAALASAGATCCSREATLGWLPEWKCRRAAQQARLQSSRVWLLRRLLLLGTVQHPSQPAFPAEDCRWRS